MRRLFAVLTAFFSLAVSISVAQPYPPQGPYPAPQAYGQGLPAGGQWGGQSWGGQSMTQGAGQQGYGGCYGCSYMGDYRPSPGHRRPAPPLRLQGQWRNGWWYY
jgi:hypothetical protein